MLFHLRYIQNNARFGPLEMKNEKKKYIENFITLFILQILFIYTKIIIERTSFETHQSTIKSYIHILYNVWLRIYSKGL